MKLFIAPTFNQPDLTGNGGIRRVVEAQRELLPTHGIDIVDDVSAADVVAMHAGCFTNLKANQVAVAHCHGLYWSDYQWPKWSHELNNEVIRVLKVADFVTAPSEWVARILRRELWLDVDVMPNGVDTREFVPAEDVCENYVLWNKTRTDPICDPLPVNEVAALLPDVQFETTFGREASNVRVTGKLGYEDAKDRVRRAGVYLCTTRETFGIGTLEAMACGIPVVGFEWGGQREFVQHKVNGYLVTPGDFSGLADGIKWALDNKMVGIQARATAMEYDWVKIIAKYAELYERAYEARPHDSPKVSIVIPSYNLGKFLPQAIESCIQQTDSSAEIIVVDDNSTDGSYEQALLWAGPNDDDVKVFRTPSNLYLAGALNYGISRARGQYILPLDADNVLESNTVELLSSILDHDRELDIAYGRVKFITENGEADHEVSYDGVSPWPQQFSYDAQMSHKNQIPSTSMYRKKVWERTGGYRRRCRTAEDADFWCRATSLGFTARKVLDAVTFSYRNREGSMSRVEHDWPWEAWYSWGTRKDLTPIGRSGLGPPTNEPVMISVVIPVGPGHEEIVWDALDSLYSQTFRNWECIVVNDTTTADLHLPSWVRVVATGGARGVSSARNLGLSVASGRTFLPLDADDYLDASALELMYRAWQQVGGYVYCDFTKVEGMEVVKVPNGQEVCGNVLQMLPHPITGLYSMAAYKESGGFDTAMASGEDWDFVCNMHALGYCGSRVPEPLIYYRTASGTRRNDLLAHVGELRAQINEKWRSKVGCGCGKGGGVVIPAVQRQQMAVQAAGEPDLILLEYTAQGMFGITYRGKVSGRNYVFGSNDADRVKFVLKTDADGFLQRSHEFRVYVPDREPSGMAS